MSPEGKSSLTAFDRDGFLLLLDVLPSVRCDEIAAAIEELFLDGAGSREMLGFDWCRELEREIRSHASVAEIVPADYVAVQCTYFRKSADRNWFVAWHQDLTIPVAERVDHPALTGWSDKEGGLYVQPPDDVLGTLVAVRVHLDHCGAPNGPLRVVAGSHERGRLAPEALDAARFAKEETVCVVARGGALAMRPLLLHASSKSTAPGQRRVLHFLFGPRDLPYGLKWAIPS